MSRRACRLGACLLVSLAAGGASPGAASGAPLPSGRTAYRGYDDYVRELHALAAAHPDLVRGVVLPVRSVDGRAIEGVEIGTGGPVALVVGLTHAREWPSGEVAMEYALDLVARRAEPRVAALLSRVRTVVVPVANPDGFIATQNGQPDRRRNCRALAGDPPGAPCALRRGVDLNRNYGAWWGGIGASTSPDSDTYRGTGPWSEPESQAVHLLSAALPVTSVVSLHNVGALVLRQPGFRALGDAPDEAGMRRLGDAMGSATGYRSEVAADLYEATGALEDWNYAAQGAYAYTVELGADDGTFHGAYSSHVAAQYGGMREALLLAAEEAQDPRDHAVLTGVAPAGQTLRLVHRFSTLTSPICATDLAAPDGGCASSTPAQPLDDGLAITQRVPASGRWRWDVGPSTRPFTGRSGVREAWTLQCLDAAGAVTAARGVVVGRGQLATVAPCVPGSQAVVGRNPAAVLLRVQEVTRSPTRVRARVTCALSCTLDGALRAGARRVGSARLTLAPGVTRRLSVRVAAGLRGRRLRLSLQAADGVGEHASTTRRVSALPVR